MPLLAISGMVKENWVVEKKKFDHRQRVYLTYIYNIILQSHINSILSWFDIWPCGHFTVHGMSQVRYT
jgi:hypothetical protein